MPIRHTRTDWVGSTQNTYQWTLQEHCSGTDLMEYIGALIYRQVALFE